MPAVTWNSCAPACKAFKFPAGPRRRKSLEKRHGRHLRPRNRRRPDQAPRRSAILEILEKSDALRTVRKNAAAIFRKLGEAEAAVHDVPLEKIHFHEVGAVDAIVDIVGACIGFEALGIQNFACSPLNVGGGTAKMAHGVLPVPAPATARLLLGKPTYSNGVQKELVTPTGAAIVATLCDHFGPQPPMTVSAIGYGAGTADLEGQPNVLRLMVGEAAEKVVPGFDEEISVLEANLDDMNPQIYGYFSKKPSPPARSTSSPLRCK